MNFNNILRNIQYYNSFENVRKNKDSFKEYSEKIINMFENLEYEFRELYKDKLKTVTQKLTEINRVINRLERIYQDKTVEYIFDYFKQHQDYLGFSFVDFFSNENHTTKKTKLLYSLMESNKEDYEAHIKSEINDDNIEDYFQPSGFSNNVESLVYYYLKLFDNAKLFTFKQKLKELLDYLYGVEKELQVVLEAGFVDFAFNSIPELNRHTPNLDELEIKLEEIRYELIKNIQSYCYECENRFLPKVDISLVYRKYQNQMAKLEKHLILGEYSEYIELHKNYEYLLENELQEFDVQNPLSDEAICLYRTLKIYNSEDFSKRLDLFIKYFKIEASIIIKETMDRLQISIFNILNEIDSDHKNIYYKNIAEPFFKGDALIDFCIIVEKFLTNDKEKHSINTCLLCLKYLKDKYQREPILIKIKKREYFKLLVDLKVLENLPKEGRRNENTKNYDELKDKLNTIVSVIEYKI